MRPGRIGLLGGTFNPIHNGHLGIAAEVAERLHLRKILFIPSGIPPHKDPRKLVSGCHRLAMVRLAVGAFPKFEACDVEVSRPGKSYTVETVRLLQTAYPDDTLFFILGVDAFAQIHTWEKPDLLVSLCRFVVLSRPGHPFSGLPMDGLFASLDRTALARLDEGKQDTYVVSEGPNRGFYLIRIPPCRISASDIRRRIRRGEEVRNCLPPQVASYIIKHGIYQGDRDF